MFIVIKIKKMIFKSLLKIYFFLKIKNKKYIK